MQFIELKEKLRDFSVFTLEDIRMFDPEFQRSQLNRWQDKGYIQKVRRGHYTFLQDGSQDEARLFAIANRLYPPSYISFEMALSSYNLIPETVYGITSATSRATRTFQTPLGSFIYHMIRPALFFGYRVVQSGGRVYKMAEIEKTVLDYLYINAHLQSEGDLFELRFNREEFFSRADMKKVDRYLSVFDNKSLERRLRLLLYSE